MKLTNAAITILINGEYTEIELIDRTSGVRLAIAKLTPEQLSKALGRLAYTPCEIEVSSEFDKLNKTMIVDKLVFPFKYDGIYKERELLAAEEAKKHTPEGWEADNYFNSQNSFFSKDGQQFASCTIRKWQ